MKKIFILTFIFFAFLLSFNFVLAKETTSFSSASQKMSSFAVGLGFSDFEDSTTNVIRSIMLLVNTIFFIFMIYAGILWLTSSGNESKIEKAKNILMWSVIGFAVTLGSYTITSFILSKVG